ncbi:DUF6290 family protein [Peloplasma aerotolerans]|uniref:DUF6290 family protein n=1 Tax=Peloplasma aerotolerans TaxID=3044389 RepID=A0AAW6U5I7_9MOLU|nr:DUF6290 family protein [Mariniplasma sp. M4Ah]MDI6453248.1 DUF6290 family protein [Mariniplasma sp. M4Ah]
MFVSIRMNNRGSELRKKYVEFHGTTVSEVMRKTIYR